MNTLVSKIIIISCLFLTVLGCTNSSDKQENSGGVVGVALGDSTTSTVGDPAVGALIANESD